MFQTISKNKHQKDKVLELDDKMMELQRSSVAFCPSAEKVLPKKIEKTELADGVSKQNIDNLCESMELSIADKANKK